ncbi:MAG: EamA family transporter [Deltaproteobacteria bacterium]|jgi:drug/metabolite transporter (DMT)-like permease|nr:EamA family transporter [Deltaproteobacteria bacterium]
MTATALALVLAAAFMHAFWNYLAKKSRHKIAFIWWIILLAVIFYFPMFWYYFAEAQISALGWTCMLATGFLHTFYFFFVGSSYERGDLSVVYPLARGFGPFWVPILAVVFLRERLSLSGIAGIGLVVAGIYVIHLKSFSVKTVFEPFRAIRRPGSIWALLTGCTIAAYSLVDKVGIQSVHPPVYIYFIFFIPLLLLTPYVCIKKQVPLKEEWQVNKKPIMVVGFLVVFTYLLVLFAMQTSNVSYVVAARELSIVFSALFGTFWLGEDHRQPRLIGAALIAAGVGFIGLSG